MPTCQRTLFVFIFLIQANLLAWAQTVCINNGMNYTTNSSTYRANLNTAISTLSAGLDRNGYSNDSVGQSPNRANAIILCRGDLEVSSCRSCAEDATSELLEACPSQKHALLWRETCMLRYTNETSLGSFSGARGWWWNPENATSPQQFKEDLRGLIDGLRDQAANGGDSLRKVAGGNVSGPDFQTIYALLQCTPDLSPEECNSCLIDAAAFIPSCCDGKRGGRVLRPSCNLRFEIYPFFNISRLQELGPRPPPGPSPGPVPAPPVLPPPTGTAKGNTTQTVIIIVVSIVACLILALFIGFSWRKRIKLKAIEEHETDEVVDEISTPESLQYTFSTIRAATNDFSDDNKLGEGGFGAVYKGELSNGQKIAVKRLSRDSGQGTSEFKNEVLLLARLQHRNLVRLLGFCLEGVEKLLVYEFVPNASLDHFIFDGIMRTYLDWDRRYKIIGGIARGILYLHEDSRIRIIHRDLKASNVLLDGDMNPKIADFGMARLFGQDETQGNTSRIVGTYGYMAPEYGMQGQFSTKSDVFSFGVLLLEIISGQRNNSFRSGENAEDLLSFAWKNWREGTAADIVDPFLMSGSGSMTDIMRCIHIGLLCVQGDASDRPTMASVVLMLSSFSLTLAVPCEPAFYMGSTVSDPEILVMEEYDSRDTENNSLSKSNRANQSDHSSNNDASITELYPRIHFVEQSTAKIWVQNRFAFEGVKLILKHVGVISPEFDGLKSRDLPAVLTNCRTLKGYRFVQ